ncbi:MAG: CDP-glucose 4,6-dehydratase [Holosporales bacterium]
MILYQSLSSFYRGKKIFLTGHTGFKGSWLCVLLKMLGCHLTGYALPPFNLRGSMFETLHLNAYIDRHIIGDIRDPQFLKTSLHDVNPDIVIHMASQPLVLPSYENPLETYEINIMGLCYLLEALRDLKAARVFLNVTSDKCYKNDETKKDFSENDPLGGKDPYSSSKACAEIITSSYRQSFFPEARCKILTARAGNVIGGGDFSPYRLIPDLFESIANNKDISLRNPEATRPWQHVLESLSGYLILIRAAYENHPLSSPSYNFGPDHIFETGSTVRKIAEMFIKKFGDSSSKILVENFTFHQEAKYLHLSNALSKKDLHWEPRFSEEQAIGLTVEWYQYYQKRNEQEIFHYTQSQIESYFSFSQEAAHE